jgi:hypothetical protein
MTELVIASRYVHNEFSLPEPRSNAKFATARKGPAIKQHFVQNATVFPHKFTRSLWLEATQKTTKQQQRSQKAKVARP